MHLANHNNFHSIILISTYSLAGCCFLPLALALFQGGGGGTSTTSDKGGGTSTTSGKLQISAGSSSLQRQGTISYHMVNTPIGYIIQCDPFTPLFPLVTNLLVLISLLALQWKTKREREKKQQSGQYHTYVILNTTGNTIQQFINNL